MSPDLRHPHSFPVRFRDEGFGDVCELTYEPPDLQGIVAAVHDDKAGATITFIGTTRGTFEDKLVVRLEYEAYSKMAISSLKAIISEIRRAHPGVVRMAVVHRLGVVDTGETSIVIAVSSVHRKEGFLASEQLLEAVKKRAEIFKLEVFGDSGSEWKANFPKST